ncbi:MAG TPA: DUF4351 domain-containing protein [Steroidobacteraceae bacterium]|jgi:predicted transposase YdaD
MKPAGYEFQSDFAREMTARGRQEGRQQGHAEGRAALVIRQLTVRFGVIDEAVKTRITQTTIADLDAIGERLLTAQTLNEALGPH